MPANLGSIAVSMTRPSPWSAGALALLALCAPARARAQHQHGEAQPEAAPAPDAKQEQPRAQHDMGAMHGLFGAYPMTREASGTSWVPDASPMHARHFMRDEWMFMLHGSAALLYDDQGGPRGDEEVFCANTLMLQGSRALGKATLGLRTMLSLEPATVGDDGYPLLFQTGETGDGVTPLVDAQHAHDLFMELAATYSLPIGAEGSLFAYLALPGEPALGPPTFMHRASGMDNPEAPLSHHWLDSTHISFGVVTLGATWGRFKLDASAFHGREPDEERWNIETGALDSESVRLSFNPDEHWAFQASVGDLHSPEQLEPDVDVERSTLSAVYGRSWDDNDWLTTLALGRNDAQPGETSDAFLLESAVVFAHTHTWFARFERVDKGELFTSGPLVGESFDVDKLSLGYIRELGAVQGVAMALGVLGSVYRFDDALEPAYGDDPRSFMVFLRARL